MNLGLDGRFVGGISSDDGLECDKCGRLARMLFPARTQSPKGVEAGDWCAKCIVKASQPKPEPKKRSISARRAKGAVPREMPEPQ